MFVQVIQGTVKDRAAFEERTKSWNDELGPGAIGYLGSTGGVTADGTAIIMARFEDEELATRNSERPEQGEWWSQTRELFEDEPTFRNTTDVTTWKDGGSDDAGFVQIMAGRAKDRAKYEELMNQASESGFDDMRPDVIGGITAWFDSDYVEAIYFTSEAEAREGEKKMSEMEIPEEMQGFMDLTEGMTYYDLTNPLINTAQ